MKGDTEVVLAICLFISGFVLALSLGNGVVSVALGDVVNSLATLVAAFAGSWAAFRFQRYQKEKEDTGASIAAGNRALLVLLQQLNTLKLFQYDFIDPFRNSLGRHIEIRPVLPFKEEALTYDVKSLEFLLGTAHQQVLFDLIMEENRYGEAIRSINTRSRHHFEVVQPKLAQAGLREGEEWTGEQFRRALGEHDYLHLVRLTEAVIAYVDGAVQSLQAVKTKLRSTLLERYPDGRFFDFEPLKEIPPSRFS